jgi:type I restriction-modification system DNA methylase subunit
MLDNITKKNIDDCRDVLVGKVPDPKSQIEQITLALIYKFMDDMDKEAVEKFKGKAKFFSGEYTKYGWRKLFDPSLSGQEMLALYSEALEKLNTNPNIPELFRNIFKNAYLTYRDPSTLKLFLKYINEFEYSHSEKLGDAFEYLLSVMGSQGDAGQFRTPRHIIDFVTACVNPQKNETVLDPACGTAGFLLSAYKHILNQNTDKRQGDKLKPDDRKKLSTNFVGYDISPDMVRLSLANMYLHGFATPLIHEYDSLSSEDRWQELYDVILGNPPFMTPKGGIRPHNKFGIKANRSEILFLDYMVDHLQGPCKSGFIIPEGVLNNEGVAYKTVRKKLIEDSYLLAIIELPHGVFKPYASVKTHVLILDKNIAKSKNEILFIQVENDGFTQSDSRKPIKGSQLEVALELLEEFKIGKIKKSKGVKYNLVTKKEILQDRKINLIGRTYKALHFAENSKYSAIKLSRELVTIFKGLSPTQNTLEGEYPLVVTAKNIRTADHFSFDTKAICIPLVSSSGHGHASVHRLHYIEGKFALANIMCGISVNDENEINPKYLFYTLLSMKDEVIASLMTGTSNVSLDMDDLYEIEVPLPDIGIQNKFVKEQEKIENRIKSIQDESKKLEVLILINAEKNWEARD